MKIMMTIVLSVLCGWSHIANAQEFQGYSDATVSGNGFSYNIRFSIRQTHQPTKALDAGTYMVKLVSVSADAKGYYYRSLTNRYYSCAELGSICNPNSFEDVYVTLSYQCKGQGEEMVRFTRLNQEVLVQKRLDPNTTCNFQTARVRVNTANQPAYDKRIREILFPNAEKSNTSTGNNPTANTPTKNVAANNPPPRSNSGSTEVYIGPQSSSNNTQQNTATSNSSSGSANNSSNGSADLSNKVKVNGAYVQVYQQNGNYYLKNEDGSQHATTKEAYDKITAVAQRNSNNQAAANSATAAAPPTYTPIGPINNYDPATGTYTNPVHYNTASPTSYSNSSTENTIAVVGGVLSLLGQLSEENRAEKERIQQRKAEAEERAANARYERELKIAERTTFITGIKDAKIPLSSSKMAEDELYYFAFSVDASTLSTNYPQLNLCGVFPVGKYGDGTWPYTSAIKSELSQANKGKPVTIVGYYTSRSEAESALSSFKKDIEYHSFTATPFAYKGKPKSGKTSNDDGWGDTPTKTTTEDTDFWGNPIKKDGKTTDEKKPAADTTKPKEDFWGNPIKKD
jgi:hypothetical protein